KVSIMEASHSDLNTAYAAINRIRCDDMHPYIYKTSDGGKSWEKITNGLPDNEPINAVREDPVRKGLLFAGSENAVYVSFDDGANWQSLRLNMPATSIRDLVIKDDDLVLGTHGRGFWILDDITPLRQINAGLTQQKTVFFKPQTALRIRWDMNTDTPLPQEEPAGQNPPEGAIIDYYLSEKATGPVTLEISDPNGKLVQKYSSDDPRYPIPPSNVPDYWIRPQQLLSADAGAHRFLWDMHYTRLEGPVSFPMQAIYQNTAPAPNSPWVMPGVYTVTLRVNGEKISHPITVKMDPRVKTSMADLQKQYQLSMTCYQGIIKAREVMQEVNSAQTDLRQKLAAGGDKQPKLEAINKEVEKFASVARGGRRGGGNTEISFGGLSGAFSGLLGLLQESDMPPTTQTVTAVNQTEKSFANLVTEWNQVKAKLALLK
ncbi:MAG: glycoside hydrolase, partial [Bacteroidota bacterium]|nr:glycoside hydrolase [Bacteroidota bacterium]